jgi:hypothetical protein
VKGLTPRSTSRQSPSVREHSTEHGREVNVASSARVNPPRTTTPASDPGPTTVDAHDDSSEHGREAQLRARQIPKHNLTQCRSQCRARPRVEWLRSKPRLRPTRLTTPRNREHAVGSCRGEAHHERSSGLTLALDRTSKRHRGLGSAGALRAYLSFRTQPIAYRLSPGLRPSVEVVERHSPFGSSPAAHAEGDL